MKINDDATMTAHGVRDGVAFVSYRVLGWNVRVEAPGEGAFGGPERISIEPGGKTSTDGVTTAVLRAIPLSHARRTLTNLRGPRRAATAPARVSGDADLAVFAKAYADLVASGVTRPLETMARTTGISRNTLSARARRARERGLLTRPSKQHPLGTLTKKAEQYL